MSTESTHATAKPARPIPYRLFFAGRVFGKSRLVNARSGPKYYYTVLITPSADEFSLPGAVAIRSSSPISAPGEDFEGWGKLIGYKRTLPPNTDPATGEVRPGLTLVDMVIQIDE